MKCSKCGKENEAEAKYCENCGALLFEQSKKSNKLKKSKKRFLWPAGFLLAIAMCVAIYFSMQKLAENKYYDDISKADTYLNLKDYKQAETFYLKAIKIDDKKVDPYLNLAEIYATRNELDKAKNILNSGQNKITIASDKKKIIAKQKEISKVNTYYWIIQPSIEADEIYYMNSRVLPFEQSLNKQAHPFLSSYVVVKKGDRYGFANYNGLDSKGINYTDITANLDSYYSIGKKFKSNSKQTEKIQYTLDETGWQKSRESGDGGPSQNLYYYYNTALHYTQENNGYYKDYYGNLTINTAFPLKKSDTLYKQEDTDEFFPKTNFTQKLSSKYAIYHKDKLISDFIYDECGTASEGLLAVKKDGKWGYVNEDGKTVIPFAYNASWNHFEDQLTQKNIPFAYPASNGYINLVCNGKWELRDITGKLIISQNEFEEITPVYNNACWVKKDGKWGLISLIKDNKTIEDLRKNPVSKRSIATHSTKNTKESNDTKDEKKEDRNTSNSTKNIHSYSNSDSSKDVQKKVHYESKTCSITEKDTTMNATFYAQDDKIYTADLKTTVSSAAFGGTDLSKLTYDQRKQIKKHLIDSLNIKDDPGVKISCYFKDKDIVVTVILDLTKADSRALEMFGFTSNADLSLKNTVKDAKRQGAICK